MKRTFISTILLFLSLTTFTFAQIGFNGIAAQAGLVLPTETGYTAGFGLGAKVDLGEVSDNLRLMPIFQFHKPGFDVPTGAGDATISILVFGADVHYAVNDDFYAGGGINYNSITLEYEVDLGFFGKQTFDASGSEIGFSALGGYNLNLGGYPAAIEARYNVVSNYNSLFATLNVFFGGK
ncbi:MAG: hypothetical protein D8M58_17015 [Calditrichaeota bacterium]|nr:MAG: hypothetical protein DWQ03_12145 [Calditrichota bacterium]MBL1207109.1 hypothetical protein [Calditrichota bacterium]NOG46939.1 hypothetical protein [Calditrichota bacterium]